MNFLFLIESKREEKILAPEQIEEFIRNIQRIDFQFVQPQR